jgi:carboxyl-terminal processing protease
MAHNMRTIILALFFLLNIISAEAKLPEINRNQTLQKVDEILKAHAQYHELTPTLMQRTLNDYLDELDPTKTYFIEPDIKQWTEPSEADLERILNEFKQKNFETFEKIDEKMVAAIKRHNQLEKKIDINDLPKKVNAKEFKDLKWTKTEEELLDRLKKIKALQLEAIVKLDGEDKEKSLQRLDKHNQKREKMFLETDPVKKEHFMLSNILKSVASSLDSHTSYLTPDEASQFIISVQQRLFGIGAQLRDDINGFSVVKIIEGGPAANEKELKAKDRIIAVDHEPVVGMDIIDAVELIRGPENTYVTLTIVREEGEGENKKEVQHDIKIMRGEVVLKETRYETSYEPFGDGVIAYVRLFSFYQDPDYSSSEDLSKEIEKMRREQNVKGIILDLRSNTGGLLSQAVGVSGLFITKGIVAAIKDNTGQIQYLRHLDAAAVWDGPLIVLVNRISASASEIVAQSLQDYGRALIVGDDHTYGKGSFQTFTLNSDKSGDVNPEGEYKVTRGSYYTVSGKTPQLTGVLSDIVVPGALSYVDVGEKFNKYPLENDAIKENFEDDLSDVPFLERAKIRALYRFNLQKKLNIYTPYLEILKKNSAYRIEHNKNYQAFIKEIQKEEPEEEEAETAFGQNDLQLTETYNIMKDLIFLQEEKVK